MKSRYSWNITQTLKRISVADRTGNGFPGASRLHERLAPLDASLWHVGGEARMRIALRCSGLILWKRNDPISDRLHAAARLRKAHASLAYESFRYHRRFNHLR